MTQTSTIKIHAFLSYRHQDPEIGVRDKLEQKCAERGIDLIYDESKLKDGDDLNKFMQDIGAARCAFVFLSQAYFRSAYTLYEFLLLHEQGDLDQRLIKLVRMTKDMEERELTRVKEFWASDKSKPERELLCKKFNESDEAVIWQRIDDAWQDIIASKLDELQSSIEDGDEDSLLDRKVAQMHNEAQTVIQNSKNDLLDEVKWEIEYILQQQKILRDKLAKKLKLDPSTTPRDLSTILVDGYKVSEVLKFLYAISREQERQLKKKSDIWDDYLYDLEQLCGWLLLNSVDPNWMYLNKLRMEKAGQKGITNRIPLQKQAYIEVIISTSTIPSK